MNRNEFTVDEEANRMKKLLVLLLTTALVLGTPFLKLTARAAENTNAFDTK